MIKIGDFSKLAHVSIKTLHHYDDLGLLKPVHVDRYSGYRYYEIGQLSRLNRILALKDLGLSLEQVTELLREDLSTAEMRGMLRLKQMELATHVEEEQARLLRVEQRLRQLEMDGAPLHSEVAVKDVPAQTTLVAQIVAASEERFWPARASLQTLLQNHLELARLKPATPWFALFDDLPYRETDLELTLAVGVDLRSGQRAGDWQDTPVRLQELPAVPAMASVIHTGDYATLPQAYASLYAWTQSSGYQPAGSYRELYLPESGVSATPLPLSQAGVIEVQCPVEKASIPISLRSDQKGEPMQPEIVNRPGLQGDRSFVCRQERTRRDRPDVGPFQPTRQRDQAHQRLKKPLACASAPSKGPRVLVSSSTWPVSKWPMTSPSRRAWSTARCRLTSTPSSPITASWTTLARPTSSSTTPVWPRPA